LEIEGDSSLKFPECKEKRCSTILSKKFIKLNFHFQSIAKTLPDRTSFEVCSTDVRSDMTIARCSSMSTMLLLPLMILHLFFRLTKLCS
jgi:hypothetical protein